MGFEVFEKTRAAAASRVPTLTVQKRGLISLNRAAWDLIDSARFVELVWDPERKLMGLRPTKEENQNAYPVRPQSNTNPNSGPVLVAGSLFTQFIGLDTTVAQRWTPKVIDGVLCVDLNEPGVKVQSNRDRRQQKDKDAAAPDQAAAT